MARPRKYNADYFSHDSGMRNNRRVKALRTKYGIEGYAIFCMLLETLTDQDYFRLRWDDPVDIEIVAGDFGVSTDRLLEVVGYMEFLKLITVDDGVLFSKNLTERLMPVIEKRKKMHYASSCRNLKQSEAETGVSDAETHHHDENDRVSEAETHQEKAGSGVSEAETYQSKVKESKVKESKEEDIYVAGGDANRAAAVKEKIKITKQEGKLITELVDRYNQVARENDLPICLKLTSKRRDKFKTRLKDKDFKDRYLDALKIIPQSPFLLGHGGHGWNVSLDWLIHNDTNTVKVVEGKYLDKGRNNGREDGHRSKVEIFT